MHFLPTKRFVEFQERWNDAQKPEILYTKCVVRKAVRCVQRHLKGYLRKVVSPWKEEITNTFDKETFEEITFERSQKIYTVVCSILQLLPDSVCKAGQMNTRELNKAHGTESKAMWLVTFLESCPFTDHQLDSRWPTGQKNAKSTNSTNKRKNDCSINLRQKKALHTGSDTTIPSFLAIVVFLVNLHWIF